MATDRYEVYALRYARAPETLQRDVLLRADDHAAPMPLDFFVWAIRGAGRTIVLDTGFDEASGKRRDRELIRSPIAALAGIGIDAAKVEDVVLSHLHWDHAGHWTEFPKARFHVQEAEMSYCTGRCMCHELLRQTYDVEQVTTAVRHVFAGRIVFHNGSREIAPGVSVHLVGGHSGGMQIVRVPTARGWVVHASDATHFRHNIRKRSPFDIMNKLEKVLDGYELCEVLADGTDHIIPGLDPEVLRRFPMVDGDPDTVALHLAPAD
jgi:glyoxylase-like metal-dependent hydrolase (beta-lactamase superfamily II)